MTFYENQHGVLEGDPHQDGYYLTTAWASSRSGGVTLNNAMELFNMKNVEQGMGFVETSDLPCCYNPDCGYFVTSNQDLNEYGKVDPINVGMGSYRSDRIAKHLAKNNQMTVKDMAVIHHDFYINFDRILLAEHSLWFGGRVNPGKIFTHRPLKPPWLPRLKNGAIPGK